MSHSIKASSVCLSCMIVLTTLVSGCGESEKSKAPPVAVQPALEFTVVANNAPHFESATGWSVGYKEAKALGKGNGVVVGPGPENPNVFAQTFAISSGEPVKIVAKASSVGKDQSQGRLQINWHDKDAKYIATSSEVIDVTKNEKTFEYQTVAPAGATAGILYVAPNGPSDKVRYTEMILLKVK